MSKQNEVQSSNYSEDIGVDFSVVDFDVNNNW